MGGNVYTPPATPAEEVVVADTVPAPEPITGVDETPAAEETKADIPEEGGLAD